MSADTIHARIRRARKAIGIVTHDGRVSAGRTTYDYVSHQRLLAAVDPALDAEGLWHSQSIEPRGDVLTCTTAIYADDGESIVSTYCAPRPVDALTRDGAPRNDLQSWGAAQSYARRLGLMAALGLRDGSDEQAQRYDATAHRPEPEQQTPPNERAELLLHYFGDDVPGGIRALLPTLPEGKLRDYLASGRDPAALPEAGWSRLVEALEDQPDGIDGDLPL